MRSINNQITDWIKECLWQQSNKNAHSRVRGQILNKVWILVNQQSWVQVCRPIQDGVIREWAGNWEMGSGREGLGGLGAALFWGKGMGERSYAEVKPWPPNIA